MATTHKPFREIIPPGSNLEFVGRRRIWFTISALMISASIAILFINNAWRGDYMNWSIDFKGGTEIIFRFSEPAPTSDEPERRQPAEVGAGEVRAALGGAGYSGFAVADFSWTEADPEGVGDRSVRGMKVATTDFGAVAEEQQGEIVDAMMEQFADREIQTASWSGDRLFVRSMHPWDWEAVRSFFWERYRLELRPWAEGVVEDFATPQEGTGEYNVEFALRGIDAQVQKVIEDHLTGEGRADVAAEVVQTYAVGARAGKQLRNDGIRSLFYAMGLIMFYLAFRFDVRFAPGAVFGLLHDVIIVVGVFALFWIEVSLTTVAAILTVIGYSVNDSVVIFDRIRENMARLKDKKFARVVNAALNQTLSRSVVTSSTTFSATLMMSLLGTGLVQNFAIAMNVGIVVGTYTSICVTSGVVLLIHERFFARRAAAAAAAGSGKGSRKGPSAPADGPDPAEA